MIVVVIVVVILVVIVGAWARASVKMHRRFRIQQVVGPPIRAVAGFAEGDGMSVVGMLTLNLLTHEWMSRKHPGATTWSYVDNIEGHRSQCNTYSPGHARTNGFQLTG